MFEGATELPEEGRAVTISRDDVVQTAVRLLDEVGLDRLTLRRLGRELGVSAPTLYWHVRDKRALLDLVAEAIVAGHRPAPRPAHGQRWWDWLSANATAQYRALVSHRDGVLVVAGNRPTENALPVIEQVLSSLVEVGFPPAEALQSILALGQFVVGSALERQAEAAREAARTEGDTADRMPDMADLPLLAAAGRAEKLPDPDATFRYGLTLIMAGMRARHAELTGTFAAVRT
jgi:TetR/AcrR family tetracycline transcriptional repressor